MSSVFPDPINRLPRADIPLPGCRAYLMQGAGQQLLFMEFDQDVELPEHSHAAQVGFILEGRIDLRIDGQAHTFSKGDAYVIRAGAKHSGKIYAGYADITFFDQPDRYAVKSAG